MWRLRVWLRTFWYGYTTAELEIAIESYGKARWKSGLELGRAEALGRVKTYHGITLPGGHESNFISNAATVTSYADTDEWREANRKACEAYSTIRDLLEKV